MLRVGGSGGRGRRALLAERRRRSISATPHVRRAIAPHGTSPTPPRRGAAAPPAARRLARRRRRAALRRRRRCARVRRGRRRRSARRGAPVGARWRCSSRRRASARGANAPCRRRSADDDGGVGLHGDLWRHRPRRLQRMPGTPCPTTSACKLARDGGRRRLAGRRSSPPLLLGCGERRRSPQAQLTVVRLRVRARERRDRSAAKRAFSTRVQVERASRRR